MYFSYFSVKNFINDNFKTDIFPNLDKINDILGSINSLSKIFNFALEAEMVSAEFYKILGESCQCSRGKTFLIFLENSEREHVEVINKLKEKYLRQN